jgi:hypothetical protein
VQGGSGKETGRLLWRAGQEPGQLGVPKFNEASSRFQYGVGADFRSRSSKFRAKKRYEHKLLLFLGIPPKLILRGWKYLLKQNPA